MRHGELTDVRVETPREMFTLCVLFTVAWASIAGAGIGLGCLVFHLLHS